MTPVNGFAPLAQMQLFELSGRRVLVMGLGESGLAMAQWCGDRGARLRLADTRATRIESMPEPVRSWAEGQEHQWVGGAFTEAWLEGVDLVCWSPGLSTEQGDSAAFLQQARARSIPVFGELDLFVQALAHLAHNDYRPRVVAVTGTNGKTTTTALTARLLVASGLRAQAAGNIGPAMLSALAAALASGSLPEVWVLELSSFQLALCQGFDPHAACLLNLSPDHLDWHASLETYRQAKRRIFGPSTRVVFNRADEASHPDPVTVTPAKTRAGRRAPSANLVRHCSFGLDRPSQPSDLDIVDEGPLAWLALAESDDPWSAGPTAPREPVRFRKLMPADALRIAGAHNQQNAMAALALALAAGGTLGPMLRALRDYRGEPHRCQMIARIDEVEYFDDSKGTNVGASVAALEGLARPTVLIAGGEGKGQDFSPLAGAVARHARCVLLFGKDARRIGEALSATGCPIEYCADLEQALARARAVARPGDAVLLSPACASFDMFRSYVHRGEVFAGLVQRLADEAGLPVELAC